MKKIFSFDAETNGLWGQAFAIAALIYNERANEIARFIGRCPIEGDVNPWVKDNVLPKMEDIPVTHNSYDELLADFAKFYLANKADALVIVHMGVPVESKLFTDAHEHGYIGDWDGPYPLIDIAGNLQQAGEDPTSCDSYIAEYGLEIPKGNSHNPLYDSEVTARVFFHLMRRRSSSGWGLPTPVEVFKEFLSEEERGTFLLLLRSSASEQKRIVTNVGLSDNASYSSGANRFYLRYILTEDRILSRNQIF